MLLKICTHCGATNSCHNQSAVEPYNRSRMTHSHADPSPGGCAAWRMQKTLPSVACRIRTSTIDFNGFPSTVTHPSLKLSYVSIHITTTMPRITLTIANPINLPWPSSGRAIAKYPPQLTRSGSKDSLLLTHEVSASAGHAKSRWEFG